MTRVEENSAVDPSKFVEKDELSVSGIEFIPHITSKESTDFCSEMWVEASLASIVSFGIAAAFVGIRS
jgi:hypothetical protein